MEFVESLESYFLNSLDSIDSINSTDSIDSSDSYVPVLDIHVVPALSEALRNQKRYGD
jgi:hypothetical protein